MPGASPQFFLKFFKLEAASGVALILAAALALAAANSPLAPGYDALVYYPLAGESAVHWINDGLMAIFFLLVGMEIKRELVEGELSTRNKAMLPLVGALGGMALPALIYILFNRQQPELNGWAIPAATDIAFSLGILSLFGKRIPVALRVFLMALAVLDDLGAVIIIAFFYTASLNLPMLAGAAVISLFIYALGRMRVRFLWAYLIPGALLWYCVLHSGVHATIAGVVLGFLIPLRINPLPPGEGRVRDVPQSKTGIDVETLTPTLSRGEREYSPLTSLVHTLHPWVAFGIMPLFAFANAGVSFGGMTLATLQESVPLGIALGLFLGKPLGIFAASFLAVKGGIAKQPEGASWAEFWGVGMIAGIGFTMSLFIGMLALPETMQTQARLGVLLGSALSGACGYLFLKKFAR